MHFADAEQNSVRGRYLNSQMGPLAATTWADEAAIRPRNPRLEWMDHMADDKNRLEVRRGATGAQ